MAKKSNRRVKVVADKRTVGGTPGAVAHPLESDVEAWLARGWKIEDEAPTGEPEATPDE